MKTKKVPNHCLARSVLPKMMTEARTVKNFLVVVIMEQGRGPNSDTHMNMKNCPKALAHENDASCQIIAGCLLMKLINSNPSPVIERAIPRYMMDHLFIDIIMCPDLVLCSVFILSCTAPVSPSQVNDNIRRSSPAPT